MLGDSQPMAHLLEDGGETRVLDAGQGTVQLAVALPASGAGAALAAWLRSAARGAPHLPA